MTALTIFCHIEKCAGTTLVSKFRNELPFRSADFLTRGNRPTYSDLRTLSLVYPRLQLISGHSLYPSLRPMFEEHFGSVRMFTVIREPIARLISNYYYDKRRGVWSSTLETYMRIPWKQNYLLRFLGAGKVDAGHEGFDSLDNFLLGQEIESNLTPMLADFGIILGPSIPHENVAKTQAVDLPDDLRVEGGVKFGQYSLDPSVLNEIYDLNSRDLAFFQDVLSRSDIRRAQPKSAPSLATFRPPSRSIVKMAHFYRNLIYKPMLLKKLGHHSLPRNEVSPSQEGESSAFLC